MIHKLAIIVPFRDRYIHLSRFIPHYHRRLPDAEIFVIEQTPDKPFNRGKLLNIGFNQFAHRFDYCAFHDVDMICTKGLDYSYPNNPTQCATHAQQFEYKMPFPEYFGGVTLFNNTDFTLINGYTNNCWGWGAEDEILYESVLKKNLSISYRECWYESLRHQRHIDPVLHAENVSIMKAGRDFSDGLTSCKYEIIQTGIFPEYTKILVDI